MSKIPYRREDLEKVPLFSFFADIVDPEKNHSVDEIAESLILKFKLSSNAKNIHSINVQLLSFVEVEKKRDLVFEIPVTGFIRVYKEYKKVTYNEHSSEIDVYSIIEVNSREVDEKKGFDEEKMLRLKDYLLTMYDVKNNESLSWSDIFQQCWDMFPKGSRTDCLKEFHDACELLVNNDESEKPLYEKYTEYAMWVKVKWDNYLWEKHEENCKFEFCLGMKEFIKRNIESWVNSGEDVRPKIKVYSQEHELAVDEFNNLEDSATIYFCNIIDLWESI